MIVFLKTEEEHLRCLCIVFECFREHNLKLKPRKCEFFRNEINHLAHHVSREGVQPSKENLKAMAEFAPPQTYTEILGFWPWWGTTNDSSRGFRCLTQPLHVHLSREGAGKKKE